MADLIKDVKNAINFLTHTASGLVITRLLPLEKIIANLREAAAQLTKGLHFPFKKLKTGELSKSDNKRIL